MNITFRVKYSGAVPSDMSFTQRTWNRIMREAWGTVGRYWHRRFRRKHFTTAGAKEYGYRKNNPDYEWVKKYGKIYWGKPVPPAARANLPLVFSGESRRRTKQARITPYAHSKKSGVRVAMNAPALNYWGLAAELTTISAVETQQLILVLDTQIDRLLRRVRRPRTKHIR